MFDPVEIEKFGVSFGHSTQIGPVFQVVDQHDQAIIHREGKEHLVVGVDQGHKNLLLHGQ